MAQIEVSYIQQFKDNVRLALQKTQSFMRPHVRYDTDVKGEGYRPEMTVGKAGYQRRDSRFERKTGQELPMASRWIIPYDYDVGPFYEDKLDRIRNGLQLDGTYVTAAAAAIRRAEDDVTLAAIFASAKTGKNGTGAAAAFDTTNMRVTSGSAGLTVSKLVSAKKVLLKQQVDIMAEKPRIAVTEIQWGDLMNDITFTSGDFSPSRPLSKGEIEEYVGFQFVQFSSLEFPYLVSSERRCPFWVPSGVCLADYDLMEPTVRQATELRGNPWEVYAMFTLGASRLDELKVGEILCAES